MAHFRYRYRLVFLITISFLILFCFFTTRAKTQPLENYNSTDVILIIKQFLTGEAQYFPEWQGNLNLHIVPHFDLFGNISAYIIRLQNQGEDVGYIAVSSEKIANPILEFSTQPAKFINLSKIQSFALEQGLVIDFTKPIYLGILGYFYPVKNTDSLQLIEMGSQQVITVIDMPASTLDWNNNWQPLADINFFVAPSNIVLTTTRKLLYGPDYWWYRGCGPTAVGNVMGFWSDRGYPFLVYGGSEGDYQGTIDQLATLMGTNQNGWTWLPINGDITGFARARGYAFSSSERSSPSYGQLVNEIDNHRPATILVNGHVYYGNHFITLFGYEYDPGNPNYKYMIVHDTWGHGDYWVQFGTGYSKIWMDTIVPPWIEIDTTPPSSTIAAIAGYQVFENFGVRWSGEDVGWGIAGYNIQYRDGVTGPWEDWILGAKATSAIFHGVKGHQYYFRSSAYDIDHNIEEYPEGDGDTGTIVAAYRISGSVLTNREQPVMGAWVNTIPESYGAVTSNGLGNYHIGLSNTGLYSLTIMGDSEFSVLPAVRNIYVNDDVELGNVILPPEPNLLINGDFEEGLFSWDTSGYVSPTITNTAFTGNNAIVLGQEPAAVGGSSTITQQITIPVSIELPTLSFVYKATSDWNNDPLSVSISSESATITEEITLDSTQWQHAWFDLSEFKGKSVLVSFSVTDSIPPYPNTVLLDDISIGPESPHGFTLFLPVVMQFTLPQ
jgi:hypothetical protein